MHNSTSIFDGYVNGLGSVVPYSMQRTVTAGDTIDFVVGDGGNAYWSDSTGLAATITPVQLTYDAAADFSASQNPTGSWRYGYKASPGAAFTKYPSSSAPWYDPAISDPYNLPTVGSPSGGLVYMHPGPQGQQTVVRWTAPSSGTFNISGRFEGIAGGHATTDVHVMHNSTSIFDGYVNGLGSVVPYSMQRTVTAGDTIDFVVGDGGNAYWSDSTGLGATITGQSVAQGGSGTGIQWLVTDQLGTPRMVFDQTGSFASVKRHDYLPFGEELFADSGGRTESQGYVHVYSVSDGNRQKFTSKERDNETGLDYFGYRYYGSTLGRWTSTDPLIDFKRNVSEPQAWNQYQYCINNPLNRTDPDGRQDSAELNFERDVQALIAHKITEQEFRDRQNARGVGAVVGLAILASSYLGAEGAMTILMYASQHPDQVEQVAMDLTMASTGSPAPGSPGTLTLSAGTRLTVAEANTGARLAAQIGEHLSESSHVGAEFVSAAGKTYDAMGVPAAYASKNWGNGAKFLDSIVHHVNKSVDHVAIDLTGASKSQIKTIQKFVSGLAEEQKKKIIYVQ